MVNEFKCEQRYVVFKRTDLEAYCDTKALIALSRIGDRIAEGRADNGKPPFEVLVIESDWPEYEPTWNALEVRCTGQTIDASSFDIWIKQFKPISTEAYNLAKAAWDFQIRRIRELEKSNMRNKKEVLEDMLPSLLDKVKKLER